MNPSLREFCQLSPLSNWTTRPEEINQQTWDKMKSVYEKVEDIDPYVGGVAEEPVEGGVVGPTFAKIIQQQFEKVMEGDRHFFAHKYEQDRNKGLPQHLKEMIRSRKLHDVICENIQVEKLPINLFNISSQHLKCSRSKRLDFAVANDQLNIMINGI